MNALQIPRFSPKNIWAGTGVSAPIPALTKMPVKEAIMANRGLCSVDGCGKPANGKRGMCNAHYLRWYRHGDPLGGLARAGWGEPSAWLRLHVSHSGEECLIWPFARGRDGRGRIQREASPQAHRAMCILAHGEPPTGRHEAAHSCGMGHEGCVNPQHLYWALPVENAADRWKHGTQVHGEASRCAKLTRHDVKAIRALRGAATHAEIGDRFGVHGETIGDIYRGKSWTWL